jgi:outer membrane protein
MNHPDTVKSHKNLVFFLLCLILFIPAHLSANEYSLDDLFRLALERSEIVRIAEEDLYISERGKDKATAALFPTLSAFGYHTRYTEEKSQLDFILQPKYTNEWGLRIDQSLSLGGREFTAYRIAREKIMKSRFDLHAVKEAFLLEVASRYFTVLIAKKSLEIANANVERLQKHRDAADSRLRVGGATKTVLLRAEAELAGAQSDMIKAENRLKLARTILAGTVRISGDYTIKEPLPGVDFRMPEEGLLDFLTVGCQLSVIDCLKESALSERAEINALTIQKDIAGKEVKYAEGSYWPDISIEGEYFRQENEPASSFGLTEEIYGGLKLDFPFFKGGLRKAEVREARAILRQAEYSLSNLKRTVTVEVENSYLIVRTEASVLTKLSAEVEYARDNFEAVTKQFKHGLADSIDVIDANTLLVTSERELVNAEYNYQLAILSLKRATGTLLKTVISEE